MPSSTEPDDLVTSEGVDEGSAVPEPTSTADPTGPGAERSGDDVAAPVPLDADAPPGPGQQLQEGEG